MDSRGLSMKVLDEVLAVVETGSRPRGGSDRGAFGLPSLGGENLTLDGTLDLKAIRRIPRDFFSSMRTGHLRPSDVLINKDGAQTGKVGKYGGEFDEAAINEHLFLLRGASNIRQDYLFRTLHADQTQRQIRALVTGSAQPGLNRSFLRKTLIPLPSLEEQRRIVEILDTIDKIVHATELMVSKLDRMRVAVLEDLISNLKLASRSRIAEALKDPLCYGIVQVGAHVPNGVPVVAIRDLDGDFGQDLHRTSSVIDSKYPRSRVTGGEVLLSIKGTIGRVGTVPSGFRGNIRTCADRCSCGAPAVSPVDEFGCEQQGDGQRELGESVLGSAVGVAAQLPEVRQPRVGSLDGPAQPEWDGLGGCGCASWPPLGADDVVDAPGGRAFLDGAVVIAAVQMQGLHIGNQRAGRGDSGLEQGAVVAVRGVGDPAHRDAVAVCEKRPFPARFAPVNRAFAGPVAAAGRLVDRPVHAGLGQVEAHDAVIGAQSLRHQRLEHPGSHRR